jgi:hypothetical protein
MVDDCQLVSFANTRVTREIRCMRFDRIAKLVFALFFTALPARAADPSAGEASVHWPLIIAGSVTLAAGYLVPIVAASDSGFHNSGGWFALPIAGPWVYLATRQGCVDSGDALSKFGCAFDGVAVFAAVVDGLAQLTGAILIGAGVLTKREPAWTARARVGAGGLSLSF